MSPGLSRNPTPAVHEANHHTPALFSPTLPVNRANELSGTGDWTSQVPCAQTQYLLPANRQLNQSEVFRRLSIALWNIIVREAPAFAHTARSIGSDALAGDEDAAAMLEAISRNFDQSTGNAATHAGDPTSNSLAHLAAEPPYHLHTLQEGQAGSSNFVQLSYHDQYAEAFADTTTQEGRNEAEVVKLP
ncbi:hypothetical protein CLAFUW4_11326 [Fulvia fulva]|uniref:Uncharacterized protein n=1 Tax=Passalora fulva TaxID=5499 RepID=A0A9Q8PC27_PASFU|nr:uncharacterized protein CLAFUR5_10367 [Fulvia fulva]KAK4620214.1 hypothetical protein CLAFUR4_11332 [Fulvia fulva]KAK4620784.1 hypothetical protein CLAFUR0_11338 [Fulvia fulva]UJO19732.1 hypothetical protein CLAFUR5_10367 [Fulvia fulva]WPV17445.1 hypothetical protein CLAFUW4_11326 [Fulvia fulva]WPV32266.1 hypothetical protein CLAFUW7_11322 [Fulvia fulva]